MIVSSVSNGLAQQQNIVTQILYSDDGIIWQGNGTAKYIGNWIGSYNLYSVVDIAWYDKYTIILGLDYATRSTNHYLISQDGGINWTDGFIKDSGGIPMISRADSITSCYGKWLVTGTQYNADSIQRNALATSVPAATSTSWSANVVTSMTDCSSLAHNGNNWVILRDGASANTENAYVVTSISGNAGTIVNTTVSGGGSITMPTSNVKKVIWTGNRYYAWTNDSNSNIYQSDDGGYTWFTKNIQIPVAANSLPLYIYRTATSMTFTPKTITVNKNDTNKKFFVTSNTTISGSLTTNNWVHIKNISASPVVVSSASPVNPNKYVILPPATTSTNVSGAVNFGESPGVLIYSTGSSLVAV
jgi:hypothetical protein